MGSNKESSRERLLRQIDEALKKIDQKRDRRSRAAAESKDEREKPPPEPR